MVSKRASVNRELGRRGGLATARNHDQEFLEARSSKAGNATKNKYGNDFYRHLASLRPVGTRSAKARVAKLIKDVIPSKQEIKPTDTVSMMQLAAKSIGNV